MPENDSDEFALALAALLHDVGKVAQRYTPGETHQSLGSRFVLNLGTIPERVRKDVSTLVKLHHEKEVGKLGLPHQMENLLAILKKADHASASHDREDRDPDAFKSEPRMEKIYRYVNINSADKRDARYFPLVTVSSLRSSVSEDGRFQFKDITYEKIYKDLLRIVEKIPYREPRSYFNTLDSVLMEYLTFVPSAFYYSKPNITLYDHLRLTAALAVSLHRTKKSSSAGKLVLIMGEASGIQQYIFNSMVSEGVDDKATKRMRGRSFMVRLATDAVVSYLLSQLDLFRFNVVWQKADGFLIIAPFSDDIVGKLELIRDAVDRSFLNLNRGIKVSLGFQTVGIEDLGENENEEFRLVLAKLSMEISKSKVKPLSASLSRDLDNFVVAGYNDGAPCSYCGYSPAVQDERCRWCLIEEKLGEYLAKGQRIYSVVNEKGLVPFNFSGWSISYSIEKPMNKGDFETICINDFSYLQGNMEFESSYRTLLQGNYSPSDGSGVIPINRLICSQDKDNERCSYLAVAKSDVDNMGLIVTEGMTPVSISRYSSLSWLTSLFFSEIVNGLAVQFNIYVIYAGGDDLSCMGEASSLLTFARILRKAFSEWVDNDEITISMGCAIVKSTFPVRRAVDLSSDQLDRSKKYPGKNALSLIDVTVPWNRMDEIVRASEIIHNLTGGNSRAARLGSGFLMLLLSLSRSNPYDPDLGRRMGKGTTVRVPDSYLYYYLRRNLKGMDPGEIERTVSQLCEKNIFSNIRYAVYENIIRMRGERIAKK